MSNQISRIAVDVFKFSILDQVPKAEPNQALILYREAERIEDILVITDKKPALSSVVRAGRYNRKAVLSLEPTEIEVKEVIADTTHDFRFYVSVKLNCGIKDISYTFKNKLWNFEEEIKKRIATIIKDLHNTYDIESELELQDIIKGKVSEALKEVRYLDYSGLTVEAVQDERARKIIDTRLDGMVHTILTQSESERTSIEIEEHRKIEIQRLEAQREIDRIKRTAEGEAIKEYRDLKAEIGDELPLIEAYKRGEISSVELGELLQKARNTEMMSRLTMFKQFAEMNTMSDEMLEQASMMLLGMDTTNTGAWEQKTLIADTHASEDIVVEDTEEY